MAFQQAAYETSDSEAEEVEPLRPLRNFPALGLITAMHTAIEVRPLACRPSLAECPSSRCATSARSASSPPCTPPSRCSLLRIEPLLQKGPFFRWA